MFYYLSFLRPPPLQAVPSSPVIITPQVSNDLRTDAFQDEIDIFYSWIPITSSSSAKPTKPIKLTKYRPENAYKEITVQSPALNRDIAAWRLVLTAEPERFSVNLDSGLDDKLGNTLPFPVISMPINFTKNTGKDQGKKKQERIERHYRLGWFDLENGGDGKALALRITEQTSFDLDKKVWDSGIGLSSWLVSLAKGDINVQSETSSSASPLASLRYALFGPGSRKIIELGAGTGIVALTIGALRSALVPWPSSSTLENSNEKGAMEVDDGCIFTTDLSSAMSLLEENISANSHLFSQPSTRPRPEVLDWDEELPEYARELRGGFDVIVYVVSASLISARQTQVFMFFRIASAMADVTYNTSSFPALIRTLSNLISLNSPPNPPLVLLGYKERDPAERSLWSMAAQAGIHFERVGGRRGFVCDGGHGRLEGPDRAEVPVEVWVGQVQKVV
ncbi:hypothetical protein GYMLUDRAFT_252671 [Collybiopsis luxurians FD-317 M1]|uniref:Methyltransferase-domain-containing protein n=1 Tax=Collybiopsis luxurians FD-317 M1 TaxID=944289 RepID=A0A0D0B981_9AGAR|nr:hypothetical protein GYMLUDRAFT_252671 [Collybiopsis luxurians FD-317 M1]